jgi:lysophospholipase L1-like esterase
MKLITPIIIPDFKNQMDYNSSVLLLGSCFTQNIGDHLQQAGFKTTVNPFGILFNPVSIAALIHKAVHDLEFTSDHVDNTFSYHAHSDLNGIDEKQTLDHLNTARNELNDALHNASHIIITLGSAWVYRHIDRGMVVANCHKQPQHHFKKELLTGQQNIPALLNIISDIRRINAHSEIMFTLSPVRHFKDGAVENTHSKARLHDAIQYVVDQQKAAYFPSYEIVMDEMRDYRFYGKDLLHLNELGVEYVWSRFRESVINKSTITIQNKISKYRSLAAHRPKDLEKHQRQLRAMKAALLESYPFIKLS